MGRRYGHRARKQHRQLGIPILPINGTRPAETPTSEPRRWVKVTAVAQTVIAISTFATMFTAVQAIKISNHQANEAVQREITDRFTAAVGELGSNAEEARIGGIYALERIARDSGRDQSVIIELLCAYVREHTPRPAPTTSETVRPAPSRSVTPIPTLGQLKTDVQAAVTVVARRELRDQMDLIDLSHTDLAGVDLENDPVATRLRVPARLKGANLEGADLTGANLHNADLDGSNLMNSHLINADLRGFFAKSHLTRIRE